MRRQRSTPLGKGKSAEDEEGVLGPARRSRQGRDPHSLMALGRPGSHVANSTRTRARWAAECKAVPVMEIRGFAESDRAELRELFGRAGEGAPTASLWVTRTPRRRSTWIRTPSRCSSPSSTAPARTTYRVQRIAALSPLFWSRHAPRHLRCALSDHVLPSR